MWSVLNVALPPDSFFFFCHFFLCFSKWPNNALVRVSRRTAALWCFLKHSSNARKQGVFTCTHTLWWICYQMDTIDKKKKSFCLQIPKKKTNNKNILYEANICVVMGPTSWMYIYKYTLYGFSLFSSRYFSFALQSFERFSVSLGIISRAECRRECLFPGGCLTLNIGIRLAGCCVFAQLKLSSEQISD